MKKYILQQSLVLILILLTNTISFAKSDLVYKKRPVMWQDIYLECKERNIPFWAMMLTLHCENGYVGLKLKNKNGSYDYGPFQINSWHLKNNSEFKKLGITAHQLQYDGAINAKAAAIIFQQVSQNSGDIWEAIKKYHSFIPEFQKRYFAHFKRRAGTYGSVEKIIKNANRHK